MLEGSWPPWGGSRRTGLLPLAHGLWYELWRRPDTCPPCSWGYRRTCPPSTCTWGSARWQGGRWTCLGPVGTCTHCPLSDQDMDPWDMGLWFLSLPWFTPFPSVPMCKLQLILLLLILPTLQLLSLIIIIRVCLLGRIASIFLSDGVHEHLQT